jgi:hypothetical protein
MANITARSSLIAHLVKLLPRRTIIGTYDALLNADAALDGDHEIRLQEPS